MSIFKFYYCEICGTMNMKNFRDDCCPVCKVSMRVREVEIDIEAEINSILNIIDLPATHVKEVA